MERVAALAGDKTRAFPGKRAGGEFGVGFEAGLDRVNGREGENGTERGLPRDGAGDAGNAIREPIG